MKKPATTMINGFDPARLASLPERERSLIERRQALLGPSYRLFYENPLHLVRGEGVWLYDADGNAYLDAYNNVPSVGHCHPKVVAAMSQQAAVLNTHTRYLDEKILDYCDKLLATFPDELSRVMFTCTGSEAVDLALRIARYYTGGTGIIITENAYHGVTAAAAEISPSLGPNMPLGVHVMTVPAPDAYRADGQDVETAFADSVAKAIAAMQRHGIKPAAFIADSIFSTDGIFSEPPGFLKMTLDIVHDAGALYIADEVQPGFGRLGSHMWGFLRHDIVPDIAVMGKPMGNGLPIAAAVMKAEVQDRFGRDIRYFNTFGANHVSIAAANAVLDIIRDEDLMGNALSTGNHMLAGMRQLQQSFDCIGDVRGAGLFLGLEFVKDRQSREPDGTRALAVVNRMRDRKVLISAAGIHGNTLKIRPPLPFAKDHARVFLDTLEEVLREMH
ncbi:aminotransferase class III-fold pyridoxal phosphate-dependent enzyme [Agrobacterium sp. a22-2]|nr:aminotransferase class III-fold pyridoxal phosphate-dependent enzyme [Agrobacterium sp. a22-2]